MSLVVEILQRISYYNETDMPAYSNNPYITYLLSRYGFKGSHWSDDSFLIKSKEQLMKDLSEIRMKAKTFKVSNELYLSFSFAMSEYGFIMAILESGNQKKEYHIEESAFMQNIETLADQMLVESLFDRI
jgi:hypothetical protein